MATRSQLCNREAMNAIALSSSMVTIVHIAGPALAGVLVVAVGESRCLFFGPESDLGFGYRAGLRWA